MRFCSGSAPCCRHALESSWKATFYPIYRNQKLLHDVVRLFDSFGLVLRKLEPVPHFDGDLVEVDAFFTRSRESMQTLGGVARRKFDLMRQSLELE